MKSKYLEFTLMELKPKTKVYEVSSKLHDVRLGIIKWYCPWKQYAFFTEPETIFNKTYMEDIINFIEGIKNETCTI